MKFKLVSLMLLALLLLSSATVFRAVSLPPDSMWIEPAALSFNTNSTSVGFKFNVTIWLNVTTPTNAWQFYLTYNKNHLNATRCDYTGDGKSLWSGTNPADTVSPSFGSHDATHGYVVHGEVLKQSRTRTGSGSLSWVEFEIIAAPGEGETLESILSLDLVGMFNSYALDADLEEIPLTFGSSTYTYTSPWTPPPPATIRIDPSKTIDPLLTPCSNFTVNVTISDASEVYSFEFKLSFDKSILNVVQVQLGDFFPSSTIPIIIIDNTVGYMSISATLSSPPAVSGNGTLAKIMFHVEDFGPSSLTLYDVEIKDEMQRTLPCNVFDGYFNNVLLAKLYVDPAEIIDPTLVPPKTFEVNVTLDDVENLYGYEFNMSFNKDVLTCLYIIVHDVLGETNYEPEIQVSNINGFVWLKVTFYSPATPITTYAPVVLATIRFRVKSIGSSVLDLHDTMLADPAHDPVPHEVTDGFVMTVIRDVAIIAVTPSLPWAYAGWPVNITVVAKNLGNISETFDILTYYNNTVIDTIPVIDLPPNAEITVKFVWNTTGLTSGTYIISGSATIVPYEFNTTNNFYTNGEVAILTVKRNIAIVDVYTPSNWAYQGWIINITVIVKNLGELNETFDVSTYYNDNLIGVLHVENLTPDEEITLTFNWNTTSTTPCNNYTIISEATPVPYEYNLADNFYIDGTVKIRIIGDLNDDGKIDIKDLAMGSVAFGSYPGHPRWNPAADINRDKKVDIKDIATISANYGNAC